MDIKTGLSIYNKQWLVEPTAAIQMLDFWMKIDGSNWNYKESIGGQPVEQSNKFFAKSGVAVAPSRDYGLSDFSFEGAKVAVIPVSGPLMKNDNCGDLGTASLKMLTQMASSTPSVQTILYVVDSPGGTVDGTKAFADAIKASTKKTVCLVDGCMASAAYWIGSSCDEVYASSVTDVIGSIGTMCALVDASAALDKKGYVIREYYATESSDKNKMFSDAVKGNGKALISEMLDPMNNAFMGAVKANRPNVSESALSGKTYMADKAMEVGLVDGIATFDELVATAMQASSFRLPTRTTTTSLNTKQMTTAEFKAANPQGYADIQAEAVAQERDRVNTWMLHNEADPKAVAEGIASGKAITGTEAHRLMLKQFSGQTLAAVKTDNPQDVKTPAPEANNKTEAQMQADAILAETRGILGIKKA